MKPLKELDIGMRSNLDRLRAFLSPKEIRWMLGFLGFLAIASTAAYLAAISQPDIYTYTVEDCGPIASAQLTALQPITSAECRKQGEASIIWLSDNVEIERTVYVRCILGGVGTTGGDCFSKGLTSVCELDDGELIVTVSE